MPYKNNVWKSDPKGEWFTAVVIDGEGHYPKGVVVTNPNPPRNNGNPPCLDRLYYHHEQGQSKFVPGTVVVMQREPQARILYVRSSRGSNDEEVWGPTFC